MNDDVKARAAEWLVGALAVLGCHKLASTKWKAERLAELLAEAGLLASSVSEWKPLDGWSWCPHGEKHKHFVADADLGDHDECEPLRLAVAVEAAAPTPMRPSHERIAQVLAQVALDDTLKGNVLPRQSSRDLYDDMADAIEALLDVPTVEAAAPEVTVLDDVKLYKITLVNENPWDAAAPDRIRQLEARPDRDALVERLESEIRPLLDTYKHDGGYNCCGCSSYDDILDHAIRVIRGEAG